MAIGVSLGPQADKNMVSH